MEHEPPPDVELAGLSHAFGSGPGQTRVLGPLDLVLGAGQTTALVGPSGCGKSTLLRLIAGLESPAQGRIRIGGRTPADVTRGARLAMAFQDPALLPWRSVRGNIALACSLARRPVDPAAIDRLIDLVGLAGFGDHRPAELSGGMRSRVAIARCLATAPGLLLLDEPFAAVDELTRLRLNEDLPRLWQSHGATAVLVTHSIAEAVLLADRILVLSQRPARVLADIPVSLPRPRLRALTRTPDFRRVVDEVQGALWQGGGSDHPVAAE